MALAAAKLVLAYAVGRPGLAPDPDRVDAGLAEVDLLRQLPDQVEVLKILTQRLGAHQAAAVVRDLLPAAEDGPRVLGDATLVHAVDSTGLVSPRGGRPIAVVGLDDVVVIDAGDAVLVTTRARAQDVKQVVEQLTALGRTDLT